MINNVTELGGILRFSNCEHGEKLLTKDVGDTVLNTNSARNYAAFINNSSVDITLILGEVKAGGINKGIVLKPRGGSYEINSNNLYVGKVSAISTANCKLSFVECI